uniref:Uncharacterized protein n=1 Tax=Loxodonta africana TaxID=9785 RepID=G3UIU4_LOXAF
KQQKDFHGSYDSSAKMRAYRELQRSVGIRIKIEFFKFFVYFVSFPWSKSLESSLLSYRVFFKFVVIHSLTHFIQKVCTCQESNSYCNLPGASPRP